jgi:tripartite-type tricarboxylate transporter receptor subunit TctC
MTHANAPEPCDAQRRRCLLAATRLVAVLALPLTVPWRAVAAPSGTLRLLCSGPPGSIPDLIARTVADQLSVAFGQPTLVDNRPGAAGQISVAALKAAPADGSHLLLAQGAVATVYPYLYAKLAYDPDRDLQPVSLASEMSLGLAVGPAVPPAVATLADLLDWMRAHPAEANVGSPGTGTLPHLLEAMLFDGAGVPWQHIAYSGGPPAVTHLLGGQIAALALPEGLLRAHHVARRLRVLATSGPARSAYLPDVPSFAEQGHAGLVIREWFAFFASGAVPPAAVESASARLRSAIERPDVASGFAEAGMTAVSSTPAALAARIRAEQRTWAPWLRASGIRAE